MREPGPIRVVINADDFGRSEVVNDAIIRCLQEGLISSATIMANGEDWLAACCASAQFPTASFGVHLNLTDYRPVSSGAGLARYLEPNGSFNGQFRFQARLRDSEKVADEWSAQIQRILDAGVRVSHLDSHHHSHTGLGAFWALKSVQRRFGIHRVRLTRNLIPDSEEPLRRNLKRAAKAVWNASLKNVPPKTRTADFFGSVADLYEILHAGGAIRPGSIVELMCHPGLVSPDYEREVELLRERALHSLGLDFEMISYHDL
ncbi:MAG: ChbG/HpnK family deacetylase [Methanoregulaceae archaeon]|nr:ChbG/HpnK family deacetylase [Methanoregulaceae archaeon]